MNICQIVYLSRATAYVDKTELMSITLEAVENNARSRVTGALLFCNGLFLQILEGHPETVDPLYEKIARDARHTDIQIISRTEQTERRFPDWKMAGIHESSMTPAQLDETNRALNRLNDPGASGQLTTDAVTLLVELRAAIAEKSDTNRKEAA